MPQFSLVTRSDVRTAIKEFDELGHEAFLEKYYFGPALQYFIKFNGKRYDSKAIMGVAHGYATGDFLDTRSFNGGMWQVVRYLRRMGFVVTGSDEVTTKPRSILGRRTCEDPFVVSEPRDDDPLELYLAPIRLRRGQPKFRQALMRLYGRKCAVTGEGPEDVLEAAHIEPHSLSGRNSTDNGLLLRSDIHTLFDLGLLTIEPKTLRITVAPRLHGTGYGVLEGLILRRRADGSRPKAKYFSSRYRNSEAA